MSSAYDVAIVGAGPAGLAAAVEARRLGLDVLVVDEQPVPGGQIWRGIEAAARERRAAQLGADYLAGAGPVEAFRATGADYWPEAIVWHVEDGFRVTVSRRGSVHTFAAHRLILATGAMERPMPVPGWTLPGVMSAGALQILLKTPGAAPTRPVVLAGTGPLVLALANQLLAAGAPPAAILDTRPAGRTLSALTRLPAALAYPGLLARGLALIARLRLARIPMYGRVTDLEAVGASRLEGVAFTHRGQRKSLSAAILALHDGVVPNSHLGAALGCAHVWDDGQACFRPVVDRLGDTSVPGIAIAGDGAGIQGVGAAHLSGRVAAIQAACALGRIGEEERDRLCAGPLGALRRERAIHPLLDRLYAPTVRPEAIPDRAIICRCEEVSAGDVRAAVRLGAHGPRQVKSYTRAGMGPCQARMCGLALCGLIAAETGMAPQQVVPPRIRFPLKPVTVAELAAAGADWLP